MIRSIFKNAIYVWLGLGLGALGIALQDWRYYAFCLPAVLLIVASNEEHRTEGYVEGVKHCTEELKAHFR